VPKPKCPVARKADYRFEVIPFAPRVNTPRARAARELLAAEHYTGGGVNTAVLLMGLVRKSDDSLVGVAQFLPTTPPAARYVAKRCARVEPREVLALSRLAVASSEPQNAASLLIGASLRELKRDARWGAVVSYADEGEGHTGAIYRASNWIACGTGAAHERWEDPATGKRVARKATRDRTVAEMEAAGYRRAGRSRKHRFIYPLRGICT